MKINLIFLLLFTTTAYSQTEEIYRLAFSDPTNFKITTLLRHKQPKKITILDTTQKWYGDRFWLEGINLQSKETLKELEKDEHHPYYHTYLFTDTSLDKKISDEEKVLLRKRAIELAPLKLNVKGNNYSTVNNADKIKGFYFSTTQPVFSSDKNFSFIDLTVYHKDKVKQDKNESYFGTICIVYKKEKGGWTKFKLINWLLL